MRPASTPRPSVSVYYVERNHYYESSGWHPLAYMALGAAAYGVYDSMFVWHNMDTHPEWFYHHYDDPAYIAWRRDADRIAQSQDNAELRAKLAKLDQDVADLKAKSVPVNKTYLPPDIKPDVALAAEVVTGVTAPDLAFATGPDGTTYNALCANEGGFKDSANDTMNVTCVSTDGAWDNVMGYVAHKYSAIFATTDVIDAALRAKSNSGGKTTLGRQQLSAYNELMFLLVNKDSPIRSVTDLRAGRDVLYVGPSGSGTEISYQNLAHHATKSSWVMFSKHNSQYEGVATKNESYDEAVREVANNPNAVLLVMMPGHSNYVSGVDAKYGDRVRLVPMNGDSSFTNVRDQDGNDVYHECTLAGGLYPKLLGAKAVDTLCVQAVVAVSDDWVRKSPNGEDLFLTAWAYMLPKLQNVNAGVEQQ